MPSINMIAPRRAEKKRLLRDLRRLTFAVCIEVIAIIGVAGLMFAKIYTTKAQIAELDVKLGQLKQTVQKIESFDKATQQLEPKVTLLETARSHTMIWYNLMDHLSNSLPRNTWYTKVSAVPPPPNASDTTVNLNGVAESHRSVGEAMLRLYSNPDISNVDLHYTQKTVFGLKTLVEFEVVAALKAAASTEQAGKGVKEGAVAKS